MSTREQFEAAWHKEYPLHSSTAFTRSGFDPERYANTRVQDGWLMWQAARATPADHSESVMTVPLILTEQMRTAVKSWVQRHPVPGAGLYAQELWNDILSVAPQVPHPEAQRVRDAWQPIETAPKTGRTMLLGYPNSLGNWRTVRGQWMTQEYIEQNWEEPDEAEAGWYETSVEADDVPNCWPITPTHWMPMPVRPQKTVSDEVKP